MARPEPRFDSLVTEYARFRTGYSAELVERVLAASPVARPRVLDLASGTGLAARDLAPRASRLVATDVARRMMLASRWGERVQARAEALPFRDASFDLVTCAQAFHWMDPVPAYAEMHRVLAPGGAAAIWWKLESPDDPAAVASDAAFERATGKPAPHTNAAREPLARVEESPFGAAEEVVVPWTIPYTVDSYVGYHASRENFRTGAGERREAALEEVRRALEELYPSGEFTVGYVQRLCVLRKAE